MRYLTTLSVTKIAYRRWGVNEYGAIVEWYWQGKAEVLREKSLYSVGGRWLNEYGAMVEWYWQGKTEVLREKSLYSVGGRWMNEYGTMVEWYWQSKKDLMAEKPLKVLFVRHESHMI